MAVRKSDRESARKSERPVDTVMDGIRQIVRTLRVFSRGVEGRLGITAAQLFVLECLREGDGLSVNELAKRSYTHQSTVSEVVARLRKKRLVLTQRDLGDRRKAVITLSRSGTSLVKQAPKSPQAKLIRGIQNLSHRDQIRFASLMKRILRETGFKRDRATMFFEEHHP